MKVSNQYSSIPILFCAGWPPIVQIIPNQSRCLLLLEFDVRTLKWARDLIHPHTCSASISATYPPTPMMPTVPPHYPSVPWQRPTGRGNNRNRDRIFRTTTTTTTTTISTTTTLPPSKYCKIGIRTCRGLCSI